MQAVQSLWTPDGSLFEEISGEMRGIFRVKAALEESGLDLRQRIVTSRDPLVIPLRNTLRIEKIPTGFSQYQLPVILEGQDTMCFLTVGQPDRKFPEHRHTRDNGLRVVISGSIIYGDIELVAGDWMYVPRGLSYSFTTGSKGCTLFHIYDPQPSG